MFASLTELGFGADAFDCQLDMPLFPTPNSQFLTPK